jgi:hypothetical protein
MSDTWSVTSGEEDRTEKNTEEHICMGERGSNKRMEKIT